MRYTCFRCQTTTNAAICLLPLITLPAGCTWNIRRSASGFLYPGIWADTHLEHRLITPRISRRLAHRRSLSHTVCFNSAKHLADTSKCYIQVHNQHMPQKALEPKGTLKNRVFRHDSCFLLRYASPRSSNTAVVYIFWRRLETANELMLSTNTYVILVANVTFSAPSRPISIDIFFGSLGFAPSFRNFFTLS